MNAIPIIPFLFSDFGLFISKVLCYIHHLFSGAGQVEWWKQVTVSDSFLKDSFFTHC